MDTEVYGDEPIRYLEAYRRLARKRAASKPHIYYEGGWWRVTLVPRTASIEDIRLFNRAHQFIAVLNHRRRS